MYAYFIGIVNFAAVLSISFRIKAEKMSGIPRFLFTQLLPEQAFQSLRLIPGPAGRHLPHQLVQLVDRCAYLPVDGLDLPLRGVLLLRRASLGATPGRKSYLISRQIKRYCYAVLPPIGYLLLASTITSKVQSENI